MKSKTIILFALCLVTMLSFGFASIRSNKKGSVSIVKTQDFGTEVHTGLFSEDKL